ncbi:MAG: CehA/McbA family metallohydrolase [Anaerolineae bacterium]|nr:CehA/McbA family metallohydrolase [Anaerolineae bacterium]
MEPELVHLRVYPLVAPTGRETEFTIAPRAVDDRLPEGDYRCELHPKVWPSSPATAAAARGPDGRVRFRYAPRFAGEVGLTLEFPGGRRHRVGTLFAVEPGLAGLLPLRGDLHTHTWYSDGRSSPAELLRAAWAAGLDFVAVTDHDNWNGGAEAASLGEALPIVVIPGEEVTFERGHLVAVGTRAGISELRERPEHRRQLAEIEEDLRHLGCADDLAARYARALWAARSIRELGGLAILAHPFWVTGGEFHLDREVGRRLCLDGEVDAIELLGEVEFEDNLLAIALHMELLRAGVSLPVVGNSDTHGVEHTLGQYWTVAFARERSSEAVLAAVKAGKCVACVQLPGQPLRAYGPLELVEYAYYLHRSCFPELDILHAQGSAVSLRSAEAVEQYRACCLGLAPVAQARVGAG